MPRKSTRETPEAKAHRLKTEEAAKKAHASAVKYHRLQEAHAKGKATKDQLKKAESEYSSSAKEFNSLHNNFQNTSTTYNPSPRSRRAIPTKKSVNEPKTKIIRFASHPPGFKMANKNIVRQEALVKPANREVSEETRRKMRAAQRRRRQRERAKGLIKKK